MAHCLILGMTESGKTTLGKQLSARYKYHGIPVIVCDSLCDPGWTCDYQTSDPDEFLRVFWDSRRCVAIIDEAGDAVGRYNDLMQRTATKGRHWGHSVHYISQRGVQISTTVRHQCTRLFLFTSARGDGKVHSDEWNCPRLAECHTFAQGNYLSCTRFGEVTEGSLFGNPWGAPSDTNRHTHDGGRKLRREEKASCAANPASQQGSNTGSDSPGGPGARPGDPRPEGDTASGLDDEPAAA
jgi:hypothetical protein